ncbi:hypothetical protein EJ04DRAFT_521257 [Polyplosphaeria fusca]|uniref:Uncharacterized protein n=1 Tax=Polyplosphaeria fusca TaxID=682080 RepID=A0A9P4V420_9PLEO|nr:hypothetical protein EJ04DRAFT_521257 [Polyplosphaeria fusca]
MAEEQQSVSRLVAWFESLKRTAALHLPTYDPINANATPHETTPLLSEVSEPNEEGKGKLSLAYEVQTTGPEIVASNPATNALTTHRSISTTPAFWNSSSSNFDGMMMYPHSTLEENDELLLDSRNDDAETLHPIHPPSQEHSDLSPSYNAQTPLLQPFPAPALGLLPPRRRYELRRIVRRRREVWGPRAQWMRRQCNEWLEYEGGAMGVAFSLVMCMFLFVGVWIIVKGASSDSI